MVQVVDEDRFHVLTDRQWELLELLLPSSKANRGPNFRNNHLVVEGMLYRGAVAGSA